jgi:hypothetical protein
MDYAEAQEIYEILPSRIRNIGDYKLRRDLLRMYRTCENLKRDISRELVNSRTGANHRVLDLYNKFSESVTNLDQYVTLALLSM